MKTRFITGLVLALLPLAVSVHAEPVVVILAPDGDTGQEVFSRRLNAELKAMGFSTRVIAQTTLNADPETLNTVARQNGAVAAVTLRQNDARPVIWLADRATGKLLRRELNENDGASSEVFAVRAVELLRASLIELEAAQPVHGEVQATTELRQMATDSLQRSAPAGHMRMAIAAGALLTPGGMSPSGMGMFEWSIVPRRWLGVSGLVTFPLTASKSTGDGGEVALWTGMAGIGLKLKTMPAENPWNVDLDLGVGGQLTIASGTPDAGFTGDSGIERSFAPWIHLSVSRRVQRVIAIRADFLMAFALPAVEIKTATRTVPFAMPWFGLLLGLDFGR